MEPALNFPLRIFVYGSLKRGYRNHEAYCSGHESARTATVVGRLYRQADGYPMLVVPSDSMVMTATNDYRNDGEQLAQLAAKMGQANVAYDEFLAALDASAGWEEIRGEIFQWPADSQASYDILRKLDRLEDFYPAGAKQDGTASLYERVIVLARHDAGLEPVWTFVAPQGVLPPGVVPMGRSWP